MIDCKDCKNHKGDCTLTPESSEECPNAIEVSIKWVDAELLSLYAAPKINGCEMTDDWRKAINALEISRKALREYLKENI